ncbi:hypothetical protein ABIE53_002350 [Burkholderia sp. OAS925]
MEAAARARPGISTQESPHESIAVHARVRQSGGPRQFRPRGKRAGSFHRCRHAPCGRSGSAPRRPFAQSHHAPSVADGVGRDLSGARASSARRSRRRRADAGRAPSRAGRHPTDRRAGGVRAAKPRAGRAVVRGALSGRRARCDARRPPGGSRRRRFRRGHHGRASGAQCEHRHAATHHLSANRLCDAGLSRAARHADAPRRSVASSVSEPGARAGRRGACVQRTGRARAREDHQRDCREQ